MALVVIVIILSCLSLSRSPLVHFHSNELDPIYYSSPLGSVSPLLLLLLVLLNYSDGW